MAHSPGDWRLKPNNPYRAPIVETDEREIAKMLYHGGSEDHEVLDNANLITAAPKLLEAARSALEYMDWPAPHTRVKAMNQLRAAIDKAEGRV